MLNYIHSIIENCPYGTIYGAVCTLIVIAVLFFYAYLTAKELVKALAMGALKRSLKRMRRRLVRLTHLVYNVLSKAKGGNRL